MKNSITALMAAVSMVALASSANAFEYNPYVGLSYNYSDVNTKGIGGAYNPEFNSGTISLGTSYNKYFGTELFYQISDNYYYVPVTKYVNDSRDKASIIIDELSKNFDFNKNLMSFLNEGTQLVSSEVKDGQMFLNFNEDILNDDVSGDISKETLDTISLSMGANYEVKEVVFYVGDRELYKVETG